jgi:hypothetical protein
MTKLKFRIHHQSKILYDDILSYQNNTSSYYFLEYIIILKFRIHDKTKIQNTSSYYFSEYHSKS